MRHDGRLSRMLHVLIHMDRHGSHNTGGATTSDTIAAMLNTNPVVVRRTMAGLRDKGFVRSEKGHGGGWTLSRPLSDMTLLDIYKAVGEPQFFAVGPACDSPTCLVEQAVNTALSSTFNEAEQLLLRRFAGITLAEIADDFDRRLSSHPEWKGHHGIETGT